MSRGTDTCKRIVWRLQEHLHKEGTTRFYMRHLRRAIMYEAGVNDRTIKRWVKGLKELKFIKCIHGNTFEIGEESE